MIEMNGQPSFGGILPELRQSARFTQQELAADASCGPRDTGEVPVKVSRAWHPRQSRRTPISRRRCEGGGQSGRGARASAPGCAYRWDLAVLAAGPTAVLQAP
jgi:hypothetical protein